MNCKNAFDPLYDDTQCESSTGFPERKAKKKIREIQTIEEKMKRGENVTEAEFEKFEAKSIWEQMLYPNRNQPKAPIHQEKDEKQKKKLEKKRMEKEKKERKEMEKKEREKEREMERGERKEMERREREREREREKEKEKEKGKIIKSIYSYYYPIKTYQT